MLFTQIKMEDSEICVNSVVDSEIRVNSGVDSEIRFNSGVGSGQDGGEEEPGGQVGHWAILGFHDSGGIFLANIPINFQANGLPKILTQILKQMHKPDSW